MLKKILEKSRFLGVIGGVNSGKTSLVLNLLCDFKEKYKTEVYVLGVAESLHPYLMKKGIKILHSKEDILNLKTKDSVIFIDEFADLFNTRNRNDNLQRLKRFFNRIAHLNDYLIISTAQGGFWNKFICGIFENFIVKSVDYSLLVNGTKVKRLVLGIESSSSYGLDIPINTFYLITDKTYKYTFSYNGWLDSKKDNKDIFILKKKK